MKSLKINVKRLTNSRENQAIMVATNSKNVAKSSRTVAKTSKQH